MSDLEISGNTYHPSKKRGGGNFYNNPFIMLAIGGSIVVIGYVAYMQLSKKTQANSTIDPQQLYNMQMQQHLLNEEMRRREMMKQQQMMGHVNPNNPYASKFLESNVGGGPSLMHQLQQNPAMAQQMMACKPIDTSGGQKMNEYEHMMQQRQNEYTPSMGQQQQIHKVPMGYNPGLSPGMGNMGGAGTEKLASLFVDPPP